MWRKNIDNLIDAALKEDMPSGDITSENIIPSGSISRAFIVAKEEGILAGIYVAERVMKKIDGNVLFEIHIKDGERLKRGDKIADLKGPSVSLLKGERTALNFLQRMSGIAMTTHKFVGCGGEKNQDFGYAQNNSWASPSGKICCQNGWRHESPYGPF